jgi:hypothetical protein
MGREMRSPRIEIQKDNLHRQGGINSVGKETFSPSKKMHEQADYLRCTPSSLAQNPKNIEV